jgi:hypothetical protein
MWRRRIDYHGTREYGAADPAGLTITNQIELTARLLVNWAKRQLEGLLRFSVRPSAKTVLLMQEDEGRFRVLGTADRRRGPNDAH